MKRIRSLLLLVLLGVVASAAPAVAHEPAFGPFLLAGQYDVDVTVEETGNHSYVFTYTITNLTEVGDYSDTGGRPPFYAFDYTGLDGLGVPIPEEAVVSAIQIPPPYSEVAGLPSHPLVRWEYCGLVDSWNAWWEADLGYEVMPGYVIMTFWGFMPESIYPVGAPVSFSFQVDNVEVDTTTVGLVTFFLDHALSYPPGAIEAYTLYFTEAVGPVAVPPKMLVDDLSGMVADLELPGGVSEPLTASLASATGILEDGNDSNDVAAVGQLRAFIRKVEAQAGKKIPQADADSLIAAAEQIIDLLSG
ncbi:MAG: hypothetical protein JW785_10930 [Acidimicrobiia bacterium]|nr:hypothetical protein [Acidimicrobiia bacterium]